jgi:hypothetical protein
MKHLGTAITPGYSARNTARYFRKYGSVFVSTKNPWSHLHPRHLVTDYHYET